MYKKIVRNMPPAILCPDLRMSELEAVKYWRSLLLIQGQ
jgi:hypothetical protein